MKANHQLVCALPVVMVTCTLVSAPPLSRSLSKKPSWSAPALWVHLPAKELLWRSTRMATPPLLAGRVMRHPA